jgi:hypothetical protein
VRFEDQFVVNLHDESGLQRGAAQPLIYIDHGSLDNVRSGPLHGCIDRSALRALAQPGIA